MCIFMSFTRSGELSAIISSGIISTISLSSGTPMMCVLVCLLVSYRFLRLCSLFLKSFFFFLFLTLGHFQCPIVKITNSVFSLLKSAFDSL